MRGPRVCHKQGRGGEAVNASQLLPAVSQMGGEGNRTYLPTGKIFVAWRRELGERRRKYKRLIN